MINNSDWVSQLFYFFNKDYGTTILYTRIAKGNVDYDTGIRDDSTKTVFPIPCVLTPKSIYSEFLAKVLGKVEYNKTFFLIRKCDLPLTPQTDDYFVHGNIRYGQLDINDILSCYIISGIAVSDSLPYKTVPLSTNDTLGLNDGS